MYRYFCRVGHHKVENWVVSCLSVTYIDSTSAHQPSIEISGQTDGKASNFTYPETLPESHLEELLSDINLPAPVSQRGSKICWWILHKVYSVSYGR